MPTAAPAQHTTGSLAALLSAQIIGRDDLPVTVLDTLEHAGPTALTFIRSDGYAAAWATSKAGAALVTRTVRVKGHDPASRALLVVDDADLALITLLEVFAPKPNVPESGVHPSAIVHPTASLGAGVSVGPYCTIGPGARVGDRTVLHAGVYLGAAVAIGSDTVLHPAVRILDRCTVGNHCIFWPGVTIGSDGFGYRPAPGGRGLIKIPHIGHVEIGHHVEIGANSCVDRGKFGPTLVGDGTKIDNMCQIAHNVKIGRSVILCGVAGVAGSVIIDDGAIIAGHVGLVDNVHVGARATVTAKSGVICDIPPGEVWGGFPARPHKEFMRSLAASRWLGDHIGALRQFIRKATGSKAAPTPSRPGEPADDLA